MSILDPVTLGVCHTSLNRNTEGGVPNPYELRIGYMKGINDKARPPSVSNPFEGQCLCVPVC